MKNTRQGKILLVYIVLFANLLSSISTLKHLKLINVLNKTINLFFFCFSAVVIVKQEPFERSLASME